MVPQLLEALGRVACAVSAGEVRGARDAAGRGALGAEGSGFNLMMEAMIVLMCQQTPVAEAAQMIAVHDT